jgi:ABC-type nitrate/sulfonate/bicarbonate transport system substrate-binding protein
MKKIIAKIMALVLCLVSATLLFAGCKSDKITVNVLVPYQIPELSILKLLGDNEQIDSAKYDVKYKIANGSDAIKNAMIGLNSPDIVIAPTNIIANIYNQNIADGLKYKIAGSTTQGIFYIAATDSALNTFEKMKGRTIYVQGASTGANAIMLRYLLQNKGIAFSETAAPSGESIGIQYSTTVPAQIKQGVATIGMLPEPALSAAKTANADKGLVEVIDIQKEWSKAFNPEWTETDATLGYPQASLAIKAGFLSAHKDFADKFIAKVDDSIKWINDANNLAAVKDTLAAVNIRGDGELDSGVTPAVFEASRARFNVKFIPATDCSVDIISYLTTVSPTEVPKDIRIFYM